MVVVKWINWLLETWGVKGEECYKTLEVLNVTHKFLETATLKNNGQQFLKYSCLLLTLMGGGKFIFLYIVFPLKVSFHESIVEWGLTVL